MPHWSLPWVASLYISLLKEDLSLVRVHSPCTLR